MKANTKILVGVAVLAAVGVTTAVVVRRAGPVRRRPQRCTYEPYAWSTRRNRRVDLPAVDKPYAQVVAEERSSADPDCTLCEQDQVLVEIPGIEPFRVCWKYARSVERQLIRAMQDGAIVEEVVGYRPGKTVGPRDDEGLRTGWSNHAFGTAIDVNPDYNGLYRGGELRHGGRYDPDENPAYTITHDSPVYRRLREDDWVWAGDLRDAWGFADWMHFQRGDSLMGRSRRLLHTVNMSPTELRRWQRDPRHRLASTNVGQRRPAQIARLLEKPRRRWTEEDERLARVVDGFNARHLAQGTFGREVGDSGMSRREIALRNWGHDPRRSGAVK